MNNIIEIYAINNRISHITPSSVKRKWMDNNDGSAYHCLPLNIANQYGWVYHNPETFTATWNGKDDIDSITVEGENSYHALSHFGSGILTITTDFLIKTPENISIFVRGITNSNKENIYPLDGIVETDWLPFTFTMNYKFHTAGSVTFKKGEPIFMFFPIERSFIKTFEIQKKSINENITLKQNFNKYVLSRKKILNEKSNKKQKFYILGKVVDDKQDIINHQIRLNLHNPNNDQENHDK
jgi:hypothetical protein